MKSFFIIGIFILILSMFVWTFFVSIKEPVNSIFNTPLRALSVGSVVIEVAIADNQQTRRMGLSNLSSLSLKQGLFFVFPVNSTPGIWMKDMKFPIDIIWMNEKLQVVDIHRDISPDTYPTSFHPKVPAKFALEVNAGFSLKYDVKIGEVCFFKTS